MKRKSKKGIFHLVFSYIKGYRKNTILSILGIAFSVMLMFSLLQMGEMMLSQFRHMVGDYPTADFQIRNFDFEELDEIYSYLQKNHGEYTFYKRAVYGSSFAPNGMTVITIEGVEGAWDELPPRKVLAGRKPEKYGEICVEKKYCAMLGKTPQEMVGEKLKLTVHDDDYKEHEITYIVSGVLSDSGSNSDSCSMQTTYETAVEDVKKYHFHYEQNGNQINMLYDKFSENSERDVELQIEIMNRFCSGDKYFFKNHIWNNPVRSEKFEDKGAINDTAAAFGAIAVLVSVCLVLFVYNTVSISMIRKIRQYGMMRCMGLSNKDLLFMMGIETCFYTGCGLVLGILAGNLLNGFVSGPILRVLLNIEISKKLGGIFAYAVTAVLAVLAVVFAFCFVYLKIRELEPVEMMQFTESGKMKLPFGTGEKNQKILSAMVLRNLKRNKSRTHTLYAILVISGVIIMVIVNAVGTMNFKSFDMRGHFSCYEVFSNHIDEKYISPEQILELGQKEGVNSVYWQKFCDDIKCTPNDQNQYDTHMYVFSDSLFDKFLELNDISVPKEEAGVVISYDDSKYQCDEIILKYAGLKETDRTASVTVPVKKILYDEYGNSLLGGLTFAPSENAYLIVSEKFAEKIYVSLGDKDSFSKYTDILVDCTKEVDETILYEIFGNEVSIIDLKAFADNTEGQLLGMGAIALYVLLAVMVLGVLIMNNIIKTNIVSREKEIGMMRSIGAEDILVKQLLVKEIMTLALRAVVTASLVALPVSLYLSVMMQDKAEIKVAGYFAGSLVVLGGCYFLTKRTVKKNLAGKNISEMLRQE